LFEIWPHQLKLGPQDRDLETARHSFASNGYIKLPGLLDPSLLTVLLATIDRTRFTRRVHQGIGVEDCAPSGLISGTLEFLLNDSALLGAVSALTDCGPIGCFEGRLYRMVPGTDHHDSWHSDVGESRLLGLSINLGRLPFEGGVLQIRRADSVTVLAEIEIRTAGDAVLFRIDPELRHRVSTLTGQIPRIVYAGWFRSAPIYRNLLHAKLNSSAHACNNGSSGPNLCALRD
jgi:hypothetical protein